ncbi:VOC family protein [Flavihumibacter sp. CACIAM 22H1]|uniref:VOC family protein n=1 Tax=Flavihumibacter sp. CACIAM 22H1 TaxID=1812911 RepID=UPI000ABBDDC0|nr:VOC family protein [Flavihumibacter sp. CACIAM 22H1]
MITYLSFNGNCRQAMQFYQDCLGGELVWQTIGETPVAKKLPLALRDYILNASLMKDDWILMGTDMVADEGLIRGNTVSILLECHSEEEMRRCFTNLVRNGQCTQAIERTYWGALFGGLTDQYGNQWLLKYAAYDTD